jgi:hypothetical protein
MTNWVSTEQDVLPKDFRLEILLNEQGKPYTTRMGFNCMNLTMSHAHHLNKLGLALRTRFCSQLGIHPDKVFIMSSVEDHGITLIWLRSRVPIPPPFLSGPESRPMIGQDFINISAHESPDLRLKDNLRLNDNPSVDRIVDI